MSTTPRHGGGGGGRGGVGGGLQGRFELARHAVPWLPCQGRYGVGGKGWVAGRLGVGWGQ